jgi:hypothetical protein
MVVAMVAVVEREHAAQSPDVLTIVSGGLAHILWGEHFSTLVFRGINAEQGQAVLNVLVPTAALGRNIDDAKAGRCSAYGVTN